MLSAPDRPLRVLIAGGGVAGLETALALHELAGALVETTVLEPREEFTFQAMSPGQPSSRRSGRRYELEPLLASIGAQQVRAQLRWVDHGVRVVHTDGREALEYDALVLALGAHCYSRYAHAITVDPERIDQQLHGVVQDVEAGAVSRVAFVVPSGRYWPLPAYELALMTARRAHEMGQSPEITLITPEASPLNVFGHSASCAVSALLEDARVTLIPGAVAQVRSAGRITVPDRPGELVADSVIALPELRGPSIPGLPATALHGFVATDPHGRVRHLERVFAAGDLTDYPVKQGGIAAQQAACVAQEIAGLAGAATAAEPFMPTIHGYLMGLSQPLYMRARLAGGRPVTSDASIAPLWNPADKVRAPYLTQALRALESEGAGSLVSGLAGARL